MKKEISCGTVIYRYHENKREFLLIHQKHGDFIGFPKGHIEPGETQLETALRETKEETNLDVFVYESIKSEMRYVVNGNIDKHVVYYLATALSKDMVKQDNEILAMFWVEEKDVLIYLTHQNTKDLFIDVMSKFNAYIESKFDLKLLTYLYQNILEQYHQFDGAHQLNHVHEVLKVSLDIAKDYKEINQRLLYVIAFYHDVGLIKGRDLHHMHGANMLQQDDMIQAYFSASDIKIMAEAIEDHRASNEKPPRSLYGKIIAEADRLIIPEVVIKRTVQYEKSHHKGESKETHLFYIHQHLHEKYGENGYLKLWLDTKINKEGLNKLRQLIKEETELNHLIEKYYNA